MRTRKIKEPIVAITKAMTESKSLEKALDMLPVDKIITSGVMAFNKEVELALLAP